MRDNKWRLDTKRNSADTEAVYWRGSKFAVKAA